jgi:hypothetical protein
MPATPVLSLLEESSNGLISLSWTNSDSPPFVRVKRANARETNGAFITLTDLATHNSVFLDNNIASGEVYSYKVEAEDAGVVASSNIVTGVITLTFPRLHAVTRRSGTTNKIPGTGVVLKTIPPHGRQVSFEHEALILGGAVSEELFISPFTDHQINLPGIINAGDDATRAALQKLFLSRAFICVRDGLGHKWFCSLPEYTEEYVFNTSVPLTLLEESFSEAA